MHATFIIASLFAALSVAAPVASLLGNVAPIEPDEIEARQASTVTLQLSNPTTGAQSNIPKNQRIAIGKQQGFGAVLRADRANIVGKGGPCNIFSDANAKKLVTTVEVGGKVAKFGLTDLKNGVVVCQ